MIPPRVHEFAPPAVGEALSVRCFPAACLVVLAGLPGAGKSTLASRLSLDSGIVSSDRCRERVCDRRDQHRDPAVNALAFDVAFEIARARCVLGRLTVFDSLALRPEHRLPMLQIARSRSVAAALVHVDARPEEAARRNLARHPPERVPPMVWDELRRQARGLWEDVLGEGWDIAYRVNERFEVLEVEIAR